MPYTRLYTVHSVALAAAVPGCQCAGFYVEICRILYQLLISRLLYKIGNSFLCGFILYVGGLVDLMLPLKCRVIDQFHFINLKPFNVNYWCLMDAVF